MSSARIDGDAACWLEECRFCGMVIETLIQMAYTAAAKRAFPFGRKLKAQVDKIAKAKITAVQTTRVQRRDSRGSPIVKVQFSFRLQNTTSTKHGESYILFAAIQGSSHLVSILLVWQQYEFLCIYLLLFCSLRRHICVPFSKIAISWSPSQS